MTTHTSAGAGDRHPLAVVILAAGLGTRMKSELPKVLHRICGRPLLSYVLDAALGVAAERIVAVLGPGQDDVADLLTEGCERALQAQRRGSGDALRAGMELLATFDGDVMVLVGDAPLVDAAFLQELVAAHRGAQAAATVATATLDDPAHYGRIVRSAQGDVERIVEARDATVDQLSIHEVNAGFYVFTATALRTVLPQLQPVNAQGELYLTDAVHLLLAAGAGVATHAVTDGEVMLAVNTRVDLAAVTAVMRRRLLERLMLAGVTIEDPASTYVDFGVEVGGDSVIRANTHLLGRTSVGVASEIGPDSLLQNVSVGDRARVVSSHCYDCVIAARGTVGPFAHIRPGTVLAEGAKAGSFVEIKNSHIGEGSKVPHLSYVGDATVGRATNIGCGNITANYDGFDKHATTIGDRVHTGSDTIFVAPVSVGDDAYTAAGSVVTQNVPAGALAVGRARQENMPGYAERFRQRKEREAAARRISADKCDGGDAEHRAGSDG
jgi:bifunctional UDP-N-acetylglucosamine pyrophosphorylase/glucosamine-1-phosphate N-acetyltransferase